MVFETADGTRNGFEWPRTLRDLREGLIRAPDDATAWARSSAKSLRCALNGMGRDVYRMEISSLEDVEPSWRNYRWSLVEERTGWRRDGELLRSPDGEFTARMVDGAWELRRGERRLESHATILDAVEAAISHSLAKVR